MTYGVYFPTVQDGQFQVPQFLTSKEQSKAISELKAEDIRVIARTLADCVIKRLEIPDRYRPSFEKYLVPKFETLMSQEFARPAHFLQKGLSFKLLTDKHEGLLDQSEASHLNICLTAISFRNFQIRDFQIVMTLTDDPTLKFKFESTIDGKWAGTRTTMLQYMADCL